MEKIGVRELRQNASKYLARVKAGETLEVRERGESVALLVPVERDSRSRLIASGQLVPGEGGLVDHTPAPAEKISVSEVLRQLREEER